MGPAAMMVELRRSLVAEVIHNGGKGPHDNPIGPDAPDGAVAAICQQPIHNAQLLADRIATQDGGMFVDVENGL
jgi:hypothetical protein